jgi:guanosine-3',5'-bis(diphosphate) 3'-pyrophosphohydrolase
MHEHAANKSEFIASVNAYLPDISKQDLNLIKRAYDFGAKAHSGQLRKSGKDYFTNHCLPVAEHILALGMDTPLICAALLHDTLEDTTTTYDDLKKNFGQDIADLVDGVSKVGRIQYQGNERHVESLRKFFVSVAKDVRVVILKLADRWHNLETLQYLKPERQQHIALESIMIHAPLASRLGMGKLFGIINDLAFPYAYPEAYQKTKVLMEARLKKGEDTIEKIYRDLSMDLYASLGYAPKIDKRIKGVYSLHKKLERKKWNVEAIYDLVALRAIVTSIPDCYSTLGAIHKHWKPVPGRIKDYIAVPKPNGYQSLHTAVFSGDGLIIEIQIRTEQMHEFDEYGIASHHAYKNTQLHGDVTNKDFAWIEQLKDLQQADLAPSEYLKRISADFTQDRIFVLTPKGDVIDLPIGATVIDFAFAIHSDIGEHASGGRVNGKYVSLKTVLPSEAIVEIVTSPKTHPSDKWLEHCVTNAAQSKIRRFINKQLELKEIPN